MGTNLGGNKPSHHTSRVCGRKLIGECMRRRVLDPRVAVLRRVAAAGLVLLIGSAGAFAQSGSPTPQDQQGKAPTGNHRTASQFYTATGPVDFPADQTIQPGDGGWAILLQGQGFRQVTERTHVYGVASYMASPKARSDVQSAPNSGQYWSVPDIYSARLGGAFSVWPDQGLTVSLGGRVDT